MRRAWPAPNGGQGVRRSNFEDIGGGDTEEGFENTAYWPGVGVMKFWRERVRPLEHSRIKSEMVVSTFLGAQS